MTMARTPLLIGIAGGTGSGKTTLAADLLRCYAREGACLLEQDSYYRDRSNLSKSERESVNYDEPEAIEHDLLLEHIKSLMSGKAIKKPVYCFKTHTRTREVQVVDPTPVILLEGLFALWDERARLLMDLKIYVHAAADLRFLRRARRDVCERGYDLRSRLVRIEPGITRRGDDRDKKQDTGVHERRRPDGSPNESSGCGRRL
jgi:uridine kinase